ncbi:glycoside hydrolase family 6 protein, partial [Streptomyces sp. NPDC058964]|uniref:glycoside hydrolase family 6 protein n=1 Tax=Streptomyces sp. NPDC058964 TaxID=3346681 RepID=UPI00368A27CD
MVAAASVVVAVGTVTGRVSALEDGRGSDRARPEATYTQSRAPLPAVPSRSVASTPAASPSVKRRTAGPKPSPARTAPERRTAAAPARLYRHPDSPVLAWVRTHPGDPRTAVIASRIADRPAAVRFTDFTPATIASRVRAVTSGAAAQGRVPVLVPYAIPDRDCGGASQGGAPDPAAHDAWIDAFARGLGSGRVIVVLEPDSVVQSDCLPAVGRADRFASLA